MKPRKTRRSQGGRIWQGMSHWDTWKVWLKQHMTWRCVRQTNWLSELPSAFLLGDVDSYAKHAWSLYMCRSTFKVFKKSGEINANKRRRDGERMRSDESLKIKMQNCIYGAVQGGDNTAVVPLLQKHLNRKSPPSNHGGIIWGLWSSSAARPDVSSLHYWASLWLLQEMNNTCLEPCVPVHAHVIIQSARLNQTRHTALT